MALSVLRLQAQQLIFCKGLTSSLVLNLKEQIRSSHHGHYILSLWLERLWTAQVNQLVHLLLDPSIWLILSRLHIKYTLLKLSQFRTGSAQVVNISQINFTGSLHRSGRKQYLLVIYF
jgi:hypothetical protein